MHDQIDSIRQESNPAKVRMALFSSGLGRVSRGFEISTARFFTALKSRGNLDLKLYAGASFPGAECVPSVARDSWLKFLKPALPGLEREKLWKLSYVLEQSSFSFGLIRESFKIWQPQVVWTKEVPLAHVLYEFRRLSGKDYKIIFANGGGFKPSTYKQFDFIQHLHSGAYDEAVLSGIEAKKMTVLPNLVPPMVPSLSRHELRSKYGYKQDDWIVISVAAWNRHHKRIDYLIEETAKINDPSVKLIICGQPEPDAEYLQTLAAAKLGERARFITAAENEVADLLGLADVFALCSLYEGLGAVVIEAAMTGLPVICHPHDGSRFIVQDDYWLADLSVEGGLSNRLLQWRREPPDAQRLSRLKSIVESRFSEARVSAEFESMVQQVAGFGSSAPGLFKSAQAGTLDV